MSPRDYAFVLHPDGTRQPALGAEHHANLRRIERQHSLMTMVSDTRAKDRLMEGMLERARWLLAHKPENPIYALLADELLEFLPSPMAERLLREFGEDN